MNARYPTQCESEQGAAEVEPVTLADSNSTMLLWSPSLESQGQQWERSLSRLMDQQMTVLPPPAGEAEEVMTERSMHRQLASRH